MSLDNATRQRIESLLQTHPVVLFMKGNRQAPRCGFSATATGMIDQLLEDYHTVDVLEDQTIREGIKVYGQWPTIPQLYVKGELIGGSDIIAGMFNSGELHTLFGMPLPDRTPPQITITPTAAEAIRAGMEEDPSLALHLSIDGRWQAQFMLKPAQGHELVAVSQGIRILVDLATARRADGLQIDWVDGLTGSGLKITNPNAPAAVADLSVTELAELINRGEAPMLWDVRPPADRQAYPFAAARALDGEAMEMLKSADRSQPMAFICHHGNASRQAAEHFRGMGFTTTFNVSGGVDAWATQVDPSFPRY